MTDSCKHQRTWWDVDDPHLLHCGDCRRTWRLGGNTFVLDRLRAFWLQRQEVESV